MPHQAHDGNSLPMFKLQIGGQHIYVKMCQRVMWRFVLSHLSLAPRRAAPCQRSCAASPCSYLSPCPSPCPCPYPSRLSSPCPSPLLAPYLAHACLHSVPSLALYSCRPCLLTCDLPGPPAACLPALTAPLSRQRTPQDDPTRRPALSRRWRLRRRPMACAARQARAAPTPSLRLRPLPAAQARPLRGSPVCPQDRSCSAQNLS